MFRFILDFLSTLPETDPGCWQCLSGNFPAQQADQEWIDSFYRARVYSRWLSILTGWSDS
ncbi:MAG: hypothetical protein PUP91_39300 [Rhizonema sp. PD37]|nr:hypothetical protein [Rhizonema sp. PD37]